MVQHGRGRENLEIAREIDSPLADVERCSQLLQADYDKFHTNICIYTYAILYRTAAARGRAKPWFLIKPLEYESKLGTNMN